uniref:Transmembrane protein n=1 Tax=Populus trichocarpa TaxID=3694 RepID=A0A2K2ACU3_POPTR
MLARDGCVLLGHSRGRWRRCSLMILGLFLGGWWLWSKAWVTQRLVLHYHSPQCCVFSESEGVFGFLVMIGCVGVRGCYGQWLIWNQGWLWFGFVVVWR